MYFNHTMKDVRHFFWDFDGTLFDTYPVIIESLRQGLREFGHDCDPTEAMKLMLDTIPTARNHYADLFCIDRDALAEAYQHYRRISVEELLAEPFEGVREVLEKIRCIGGENYIYTHRKSSETLAYLEKYGLDGYFSDILGDGSPGFAVKPAPDSLLYLMEKHGIDPAQAVMVGDRDRDLGSGQAAGMRTAHFVCAAFPEELPCDWRFESFSEMLALLQAE